MLGCLWDLLTWPIQLALGIIGWVMELAGNLTAFIIGLVICAVGAALCMTLIGAVIGLPLVIFGGGLMLKSIF